MGQSTTFIMVLSGLLLVFYLGGMMQDVSTPNTLFLDLVTNPQGMQSHSLLTQILAALTGAAAISGLIVGIVSRDAQFSVKAPVAAYLLNLGYDFVTLFGKVYAANEVIALLLFGVIFLMYIVAVFGWWSGND